MKVGVPLAPRHRPPRAPASIRLFGFGRPPACSSATVARCDAPSADSGNSGDDGVIGRRPGSLASSRSSPGITTYTRWLADENFAADREAAREVLERLLKSDLGLSLNLNMTAADVIRDADLMPLYKRAGVDNIVLGIESLEDGTIDSIRKNNPFQTSLQAVRLLRRHGIVSLVNLIYGLEDESWRTLRRTFRRLLELDPDILNAVYLTPHHWTAAGLSVDPASVIQSNQALFTYRNQVLRAPRLSPWEIFLGVKATEALFHLRPHGLLRLWTGPDGRYRRILRSYLAAGIRVVAAEIGEFLFGTRFSVAGSLDHVPGYPRPPHRKADDTRRGESPSVPAPERTNRVRDRVG